MTRKGQITIPADIRRALGLTEGDAIDVRYDETTKVATFSAQGSIVERTAGILRQYIQDDLDPDTRLQNAIGLAYEAAAAEANTRNERARAG